MTDLCTVRGGELPPELRAALARAVRLEWISLGFFVSALVFTGLVMGQSQALKTTWIDDALGMVPPIAFLIAARVRRRAPDRGYPYGWHRCVTIAFLCAAVALLGLGVALVVDGLATLIGGERPTITAVRVLGREVWLGWFMLAALVWSAAPTVFLGRIKRSLARTLHDKALRSDAEMNSDDWQAGAAAIVGIVGIALGFWWTDAAAGCLIATSITADGWRNLRTAVADLMDRRPRTIDDAGWDPLPDELEALVAALPWVRRARVRMREHGHVYFGEVFVVPVDGADASARVCEVHALGRGLGWRIHDLTVQLCDAEVGGADSER